MANTNTPINKGHFELDTQERHERFQRIMAKGWEEEYKKYRRSWEEFPKKKIVAEYPLQVDLELSTVCNLSCPMCYTTTEKFKKTVKKQFMDTIMAKKVIDEVAGKIYALRLSLRGEPTLHPDFLEILTYAKNAGIKEISFLTNCSRMDVELFKKIAESGASWISISLDGLGEDYNAIRRPLKFEETFEKLKAIHDYKISNGLEKPVIKVQSVWPAIRDYAEKYYNTISPYVDLIAFNPLVDYLGKDEEIVYEEKFYCPQQYERLVVSVNGEVMMCSCDEYGENIVGDANHESIYEIWHGEKLQKVRDMHKLENGFMQMEMCTKCFYPRKMIIDEESVVNGRKIHIYNYINRKQKVGE